MLFLAQRSIYFSNLHLWLDVVFGEEELFSPQLLAWCCFLRRGQYTSLTMTVGLMLFLAQKSIHCSHLDCWPNVVLGAEVDTLLCLLHPPNLGTREPDPPTNSPGRICRRRLICGLWGNTGGQGTHLQSFFHMVAQVSLLENMDSRAFRSQRRNIPFI